MFARAPVFVALFSAFGPAGALAQAQGVARHDSTTVVFVCEHGTVKSVLAIALFKAMAAERGLAVRAISRGTAPDSALPPFMKSGLASDGLSIGTFTPMKFTSADLGSAILVVSLDAPDAARTVGSKIPLGTWNGTPSVSADYAIARDAMRVRVRTLVDSLAAAARR